MQMELELVRLSALNPSKHAMSVATGPPPPALEEAPVADVRIGNGDGSAPSAGFSRQPKGTFVLREKRFAPKTLGPRKVGFSRQEAGTFVLRSKKFVPKSLSRGSGFHRPERGSFQKGGRSSRRSPGASSESVGRTETPYSTRRATSSEREGERKSPPHKRI